MTSPTRIVTLGGGFGGAYDAQYIEERLRGRKDLEIIPADRRNHLIFHPHLVEAGSC